MNLQPRKGRLLIADPSILNDISFKRSAILLTEYSEANSVGFILNKPTQFVFKDLIPDVDCDFTIYEGGPVEQDNLYFIHRLPELLTGSKSLSNGLYWGGNFNDLKGVLNNKNISIDSNQIRFFLGYSGWSASELDEELKTHSWFITENDFSNILEVNSELLWKKKILEKGGEYTLWANAPIDIQMN